MKIIVVFSLKKMRNLKPPSHFGTELFEGFPITTCDHHGEIQSDYEY